MGLLTSPGVDDLITNVRNLLNQPDPTNSFWTDEELLAWLNEATRRYFQEVVHNNEGLFTAQTDLDLVTDSETVDLPSDCFSVKVLYRKINSGYEVLPYRNNLTNGYTTIGSGSGQAYMPEYMFRGNSLVLHPLPNFSETGALRLEYIQFPATMVSGGDTLTAQVSPVFRDLIEMYAVWKAKIKESLMNNIRVDTVAAESLKDLYTAFKESINQRSQYPVYVQAFNPETA